VIENATARKTMITPNGITGTYNNII